MPNPTDMPLLPDDHKTTTLQSFSAYDLPSVEALIRYLHAAAGFSIRNPWVKFIKSGNFASWPGLTYQNASKTCPITNKILKGHMAQVHQGICYTKPNPNITKCKQHEANSLPRDTTYLQEIHIMVEHIKIVH